MNTAEKYERDIAKLHTIQPRGFNPQYREGLGEAESREYAKMCEEHPNASKEFRKARYQEIRTRLLPLFPSVAEPRT